MSHEKGLIPFDEIYMAERSNMSIFILWNGSTGTMKPQGRSTFCQQLNMFSANLRKFAYV